MWRRTAWRRWSNARGQDARGRKRHRHQACWKWICSPFVTLSEMVGLFYQPVSQVICDFEGFVFAEAMFSNKLGQEGAIDAAGYIVPGWDRKECASVVVETYCVIEARCLRGLLAK